MATEYIGREAAIKEIKAHICFACPFKAYSCTPEKCGTNAALKAISEIPAADVWPVAEISGSVDEAINFLNSVSDQMPYHVYSALFDLICGICPNCGADTREVSNGTP